MPLLDCLAAHRYWVAASRPSACRVISWVSALSEDYLFVVLLDWCLVFLLLVGKAHSQLVNGSLWLGICDRNNTRVLSLCMLCVSVLFCSSAA
jgi:hypothetical protein